MNLEFLPVGDPSSGEDQRNIAVRKSAGKNPGLIWLGGYRSDMLGGKAMTLQNWADENDHACCRFDYSGHGESGGDFMIGNISRWLEESLAVFKNFTEDPQILVGSSMGCWIALRMSEELKKSGEQDRLHGMILLAPAPDFTKELTWPNFTEVQKKAVLEKGFMEEPTDDPEWKLIFTKTLFDDGENNFVLKDEIVTECPVHIIQGGMDDIVPKSHALRLATLMPQDDVTMTIIKDGDHRLSREEDLKVLIRAIENMIG